MNLNRKKVFTILATISLLISLFCIGLIYIFDLPLYNNQLINFQDENGDPLVGTYIKGTKNAGVMVLEGFGSDQMAMKSISSEFTYQGFHVFTFDFSGHGISPGTISFDNAATDRLAKQVLSAKEKFKSLSGLNDNNIILIGHSMGARVALQSATFDPYNVSGLILIGVQVNLDVSVQAGFFTGISDTELEWVNNLSHSNPATDLAIISGTFDDILSPKSANLLYEKLGGETSNYTRNLEIFDFLFHNYEIFSPAVISYSINWALMDLGLDSNPNFIAVISIIRKVMWYIAVGGMFMFLILVNKRFEKEDFKESEGNIKDIKIIKPRKYLFVKGIFWIFTIPITFGLVSLLFFIPLGIPIFSLIYVGLIGGYGILMLILYRYDKVPGAKGRLKLSLSKKRIPKKTQLIISIGLILFFVFFGIFFANSGIFFVFALNTRLLWLVILSFLTIPGFLISQKETEFLKNSFPNAKRTQLSLTIIGFVPFIAVTIFFLILGSLSGMIGSIHGLVILAYVVFSGGLIQRTSKSTLLKVIFQAFLIQLLVLPQGALFAIF